MSNIKPALVISGDGINCEIETAHALSLAGFQAQIIHLNDLIERKANLDSHSLVALPGGFSFGDELGSGRVLALKIKKGLGWNFNHYAEAGGLVIGICNGFQALIRMGVFGNVSITHNASGKFLNRWMGLRVPANPKEKTCKWLLGPNLSECEFDLPIRHGEGRIVFGSSGVTGKIALEYTSDINGSEKCAAGLTDSTGRILGLMPHPEASVRFTQRPDWTRHPHRAQDAGVGFEFFKNAFLEAKRVQAEK